MKKIVEEIIDLFWDSIEKKGYTWEELNKGKTISFVCNGREYKVQTRLGNFWSMGVSEYAKMLEKRAVNVVFKEDFESTQKELQEQMKGKIK